MRGTHYDKEEARKINQTAANNAAISIKEAELRAEEIKFAFETEAAIIAKVRENLNLTTVKPEGRGREGAEGVREQREGAEGVFVFKCFFSYITSKCGN